MSILSQQPIRFEFEDQLSISYAESYTFLCAAVQIHFLNGVVRADVQAFGSIGDLAKPAP